MGDVDGSSTRSSAANLYRSRWSDDKYSARPEPVHAGYARRVHDDAERLVTLSGHADTDAEANSHTTTACEREYGNNAADRRETIAGASTSVTDARENAGYTGNEPATVEYG